MGYNGPPNQTPRTWKDDLFFFTAFAIFAVGLAIGMAQLAADMGAFK